MKRRLKWLAVGAATLLAGIIWFARPTKPSVSRAQGPNGYDDFLAAMPLLVPQAGDWDMKNVAQLQVAVEQNSNALAIIRRSLDKPWRVPYGTNAAVLTYFPELKTAGRAFWARGRIAESGQRTNEALQAYTDCLRFGQHAAAEGLMIHDMISGAIMGVALQAVRRTYSAADRSTLQELIQTLAALDDAGESADSVIAREKDWARQCYGSFRYTLTRSTNWRTYSQSERTFTDRHLRLDAEVRLLMTDCALALYQRENGHWPTTLDELVPRYLKSVPRDPFSGQPMIYRPGTNSYSLYSIGPDRIDDGGKPLSPVTRDPKGDVLSTPPKGR